MIGAGMDVVVERGVVVVVEPGAVVDVGGTVVVGGTVGAGGTVVVEPARVVVVVEPGRVVDVEGIVVVVDVVGGAVVVVVDVVVVGGESTAVRATQVAWKASGVDADPPARTCDKVIEVWVLEKVTVPWES